MSNRSAASALALLVFAMLMAAAGDASAQRTREKARESSRELVHRDTPRERGANEPKPGRSADHRALSDAVRRVERSTGGQVLSAERVPYDGRDVSRVKVVDSSGRVRVYVDDPRNRSPQSLPRTRHDDD